MTGLHAFDEFLQSQLIFAAFNIATFTLRRGGTFVSKVFLAGSDGVLLKAQMSLFFKTATFFKPQSSRTSSSESFIICSDYSPPGI